MIETLNQIGAAWWSWVRPMLWQVALLALVIWVLDLALTRRGWPQVRYALWLLVLVKFFIPPSFSLPSSITARLLPAERPVTATIALEPATPVEPMAVAPADFTTELIPGIASPPASAPTEASVMSVVEAPSLSPQAWGMMSSSAVSLLLFCWLLFRSRRLRLAWGAGSGDRASAETRNILADSARKLGLRRPPRVVVTELARGAAVFGVFRPVLLLPAAVPAVPRRRMEHILLHELAHVKRGDLFVNAFQTLVHVLFWFHPAVWLAGRRLRHLRELCCDATVSKVLRERTGEYRATLAEAAREMLFGRAGIGLGLIGLFESPSRIDQRLQHLERPGWKHARLKLIASLAAVALMLTLIVPMAKGRAALAAPSLPSAAPAAPAPLDSAARPAAHPALNAEEPRVLHFPKDRSLGTLQVQDVTVVRRIKSFYFHTEDDDVWETFAQATGDVVVPAGKRVKLIVHKAAANDLSPLGALRPDDLYALDLGEERVSDDRCMPHLGRLTGLKVLKLYGSAVTDDGLGRLEPLTSLERLWLPEGVSGKGLAHIARLPALKAVYIYSPRLTRQAFSHLARIASLEELALVGDMRYVDYTGLPELAKLPSLTYLAYAAPDDRAMAYVGKLRSLRTLNLGWSKISDAGMAPLSNLTQLEVLALYHVETITGAGLAHLRPLHSLRKLHITFTGTRTEYLSHITALKSLEDLKLPWCFDTDDILAQLAGLPHLKVLSLGMYSNSRITDAGLAHLTRLPSLERLSICGRGITDEGMSDISRLTNLKSLDLGWLAPSFSDEGIARLSPLKGLTQLTLTLGPQGPGAPPGQITISGLSHLNAFPQLKELELRGVLQDGSGLNIAGLTKLEKLFLFLGKGSSLRDDDLASLARLERLGWLQMDSCTDVTDVGAAHLGGLASLWRLHMGDSRLTDKGLGHLANLKSMEDLAVGGDFTSEGLRQLEELKALRILRISSRHEAAPGAMENLRRRLPNLRLFEHHTMQQAEGKAPPRVGDVAPQFTVKTLDGRQLRLSDYRGKVVLLYFWSTSCTPCVASTPQVKAGYEELSAYGHFEMISISLDDFEDSVRRHVEDHELSWPQACVGMYSQIAADYGVKGLPTYIFVGPDGRILPSGEADVKAALEALRAEKEETV